MQFALVLYSIISFCIYIINVIVQHIFSHLYAEKLALSCQRKSEEETEGDER
jgi:hypothetical protein